MNYIEFEVGGKLRGFKFGVGALGDILKELDTDIKGYGEMLISNRYKSVPTTLFHGHKHDCWRKQLPITFTRFDVDDWLEDLPKGVYNDNIAQVENIIVQQATKHIGHLLEEVEGGEKKN